MQRLAFEPHLVEARFGFRVVRIAIRISKRDEQNKQLGQLQLEAKTVALLLLPVRFMWRHRCDLA